MSHSFYEKYKSTVKIRTKRQAYVLSITWLVILFITLFSRLYFANMSYTNILVLQFVEIIMSPIGYFSTICDRIFITHVITGVLLYSILRLLRRARSLNAMNQKDYIAIIILNSISIIIVIMRSFLPIGDSLKFF
jgi:hypothetical protein